MSKGPQTTRLQRRTAMIYGAMALFGMALALAGSPAMQAFGLGLVIPGGGFAAAVTPMGIALALLSIILFAVAIFLWFATGNVIAPPVVWIATATIASAMASDPASNAALLAVPTGPVAAFALIALWPRRKRASPPAPFAAPAHPAVPILPEDLARLRFALDRALQPVGAFDGFEWIDQFQPAGMRYQLNFAGYALALANRRLPAFRGYLHEAQRRLIEKQRDWRVWRYWRLEEAWGNLTLNADPILRDNIMYTGFVGAQIAWFQATTGDMRYSQPGAFTLQTPRGEVFAHDFGTMTDALMRGWNASPYTLMPCEPNWVYPMCNAIGANAVRARDAQQDGTLWSGIAGDFENGLTRELMDADGHPLAFRSTLTGFAPPAIGGAAADATPALFLNGVLPDTANRIWSVARAAMLHPDGSLDRRRFWPIDTGNYRFSRAASCTAVAAAATELGDPEVAALALAMLDGECPAKTRGGVTHRDNASVFAHFVELMARFGGQGALADLTTRGIPEPEGPVLETMDYPAILVSRADWNDGALCLTLHPGTQDGPVTLPLSNCRPHARLRMDDGTEVRADASGKASLSVSLTEPSVIRIVEENP